METPRNPSIKGASCFDIFGWIVLIILGTCAIGVFCMAGWLPGHIAKSRGHPQPSRDNLDPRLAITAAKSAAWPLANLPEEGF
jgi:hypothetical protein